MHVLRVLHMSRGLVACGPVQALLATCAARSTAFPTRWTIPLTRHIKCALTTAPSALPAPVPRPEGRPKHSEQRAGASAAPAGTSAQSGGTSEPATPTAAGSAQPWTHGSHCNSI